MQDDGTNTVEGSAFLRQRGGDVVTCAGETVSLIPQSAYAAERVLHAFGTTQRAAISLPVELDVPVPEYERLILESTCDAQGDFVFRNVPDGGYYVWTRVTWEVSMSYGTFMQGGAVMAPVEVAGGEAVSLVISP